MKIYLDACCLSRLTDDQSQNRIKEEAAAIELIFGLIALHDWELISSQALQYEVAQNPSSERRVQAESLLASASAIIFVDAAVAYRANRLATFGYGAFDALHLAAAEAGKVDVLLSTDGKFIRMAARGIGHPKVSVENPVFWVKEHRT